MVHFIRDRYAARVRGHVKSPVLFPNLPLLPPSIFLIRVTYRRRFLRKSWNRLKKEKRKKEIDISSIHARRQRLKNTVFLKILKNSWKKLNNLKLSETL